MYIHEYSGIDKADPLDVSAVNKGTAAAMNSGSATTSNANDLIFGAGASASTVNQAGSGFTSRSTRFGNRTEDKNVTAAGPYNATANQNGNAWVMHMAAFKADPGTPDTTPPSKPTGLTATPTSTSQINLNWNASTDDVGVTGYKVFRNGTQIATPTSSVVQRHGPDGEHHIRLRGQRYRRRRKQLAQVRCRERDNADSSARHHCRRRFHSQPRQTARLSRARST